MRILSVILGLLLTSCAHQTAFQDKKLKTLWAGMPVSDQTIEEAKKKWPNETVLLDLQEGLNLLRKGGLTPEEQKRAETYLEAAYNTFEDLKDPENFSKAFTPDSKIPFRGKPYERMIAAILLGLMDVSAGRCDKAMPAFRSAEFLDARWQAFMYGSDAPMVYALTLRCQIETKSSSDDLHRTRAGLFKAIRLQVMLEPILQNLASLTDFSKKDGAKQIALSLLEVGLPSALLVAPENTSLADLFSVASAESMRFYARMKTDKEEPYYSAISKLEKKHKVKEAAIQAGLTEIERSLREAGELKSLMKKPAVWVEAVEVAIKRPVMGIYFDGIGPSIEQEGQYKEIAKIVPGMPAYAIAGISEKVIPVQAPCGISNPEGNLIFTICRNPVSGLALDGEFEAIKLWSSSFQATTMAGRKFDKILKGRAQFRMGTEIAALVGAYTALALLDAGLSSNNSSLQAAGAIVGAVALGAWIAGRATNPEADTRQVMRNIETGYLITPGER